MEKFVGDFLTFIKKVLYFMYSKYLENIEKINRCVNFSTENKEKIKQLYYYIYNEDCFQVYYKYEFGKTFNFYHINELVLNLSGYSLESSELDYLELYFNRHLSQIVSPIFLHEKYFYEYVGHDFHNRIDFIKQDLFPSFLKDIDVFKIDKIKDPFNNIKEGIILKERVLNLDLEE